MRGGRQELYISAHTIPGVIVTGAPDTLVVNDLSVLAATVNAQLFTAPAASQVRPYVLVGTGPYRVESEIEVYGQRRSGADTKLGSPAVPVWPSR